MATLNNFSVMVSSLKMSGKQSKVLHGLTWKHDRGLAPLLATARHFSEARPEVTIEWEARSLQEFGETLLQGLADRYELIVIDHPFMGRVAKEKCFLPLDQYFTPPQLRELEENSVGQSYQSYHFDGHQWALPIDAAALAGGVCSGCVRRDAGK